jgi:Uma2 family endonuclease
MSAVTSILDIPEARARVSPITVAQYHAFPEFNENGKRTELIRGIVFEKMSKSPLHSSVAKFLYDLILALAPHGFSVRQDQPLTLQDSEPEPDIAIVAGSDQDFRARHPTTAALVIEIAISSVAMDREKAAVYSEAGVEEYWIVLPAERRVEVYRQPLGGSYLERFIVEGDALLTSSSVPHVEIRLAELFE